MVAVETVLWFPRSGGRVLGVHGSGSFHRPLLSHRWMPVASSRTPGVARASGAPGVDPCLDESPWCTSRGESREERQYRADDARRLTGLMKGGHMEEVTWYVGIDWGSESHAVCLVDAKGGTERSDASPIRPRPSRRASLGS